MELKVVKESITTSEVLCDSVLELPIESDMLLPDYCPDIMKILKCCASPVFTTNTVEGGSLTVEGYAQLTLYYLSDAMQVRCGEGKMPFSKVVEIKGTMEQPMVSVSGSVEYLNCRAVNQRRVDIRGAMNLSVKVLDQHGEEMVHDAHGGGMQLKKRTVGTTALAGSADRQFTIREELELGTGKTAIGTIIRKQVQADVTDCKVISGKVVAKGELAISLLYVSTEDNKLETMAYSLPVSQIVDITGVDEHCRCDMRMDVLTADIQPKADLDGENTLLSAEITMCARAKAYRTGEMAVIADAYSTECETVLTEKSFTGLCLAGSLREQRAFKQQMNLPEEVTSVLHLWCEATLVGCKAEAEHAKATVRMNICMFALDREQNPAYFEQSVEQEFDVEFDGGESMFHTLNACAGACEFTLTGGGVEVRCEVALTGTLFANTKCTAVADLTLDEARPCQRDANTALTIYFAQPGEEVWDIAKRYRTSVAAVMEENAIEHETLQGRVTLLIPMVV